MVESDEEQLEVLKKWWDENGTSLLVTIVIALGAVFGFRAWETNVRETGEAASVVYQDLVSAAAIVTPNPEADAENDAMLATANSLGETLKSDFEGSTYSVFGALHLARLAVDRSDLDKAESELRWALERVEDPNIETLVRMRLARVLVAGEDAAAAMSIMLAYTPVEGQLATWHETLGDVYLAVGDQNQARDSYQTALDNLQPAMNKTLLELKLSNIPVEGQAPVVQAEPESELEEEAVADDVAGEEAGETDA